MLTQGRVQDAHVSGLHLTHLHADYIDWLESVTVADEDKRRPPAAFMEGDRRDLPGRLAVDRGGLKRGYRGSVGIMETKMATAMMGFLGFQDLGCTCCGLASGLRPETCHNLLNWRSALHGLAGFSKKVSK